MAAYSSTHALRIGTCGAALTTGANVYDKEDNPEAQYERSGTPATSYLLLGVLVAVVGLIAVLAAWTSA
jgi:hypothetical protein